MDGAAKRSEGRFAHVLFVVEQFEDFIQFAGIDRFGNPGQAAGFEYPGDFSEGLIHQLDRHMVQGFEHEHDIDTGISGRNGFGAAGSEGHAGQGLRQVSGVLDLIDLERQDVCRATTGSQGAGFFRTATAEFEHRRSDERQSGEHQLGFIDQVVCSGVGDLHWRDPAGKVEY